MATVAVRGLAEDGADSANAHRPLIEDRRVVLRGAGKHVGTLHQRNPSLVMAPPRGLHLRSAKFAVCLEAEAFRRDRVRRLKNGLENDSLGWNDSRHLTHHRPAAATSRAAGFP
jgi:hypothetical protein